MHGGHLIREARRRAGLTQAELADRVGTAQPNVARWESANMSPSMDTLTKVIRACGLDLLVRLIDHDDAEWTSVTTTKELTPEERLDQLVTFVDMLEEGRPTKEAPAAQASANG